jgi:Gluconate 2-dehydrogenase subunit 3
MNWTRREFLSASAAVPLIAIETRAAASNAFNEHERTVLRAAMDEIIPASVGMPAASEVGGMAYLERIAAADADVANEIRAALAAFERTSEQPFDQLDHEARVAALKSFEAANSSQFAHLRDYIYESYYTQPSVWKLIGYEFYPTDHPGPHMEPFDDSILAEVRKRPKLYREA